MLKQLFAFFDANAWAYWTLAAIPAVVLAAWTIAGFAWSGPKRRRPGDIAFALLLLVVLFAGRWPLLLNAREVSSDESQLIAAALTLRHDPVFWRSVDTATAGPLDSYALLPLHAVGVHLDFFEARLTGLLLVWAALLACFVAARCDFGSNVARLTVLPGTLFFAGATEGDLTYYTTEHVPIALFGVAFALLWSARAAARAGRTYRWRLYAGTFIAGLLPWAKLQAGPLSVALGVLALVVALAAPGVSIRRRVTAMAGIVVASLAPTLLALAGLARSGQLETFWRSYVLQNIVYVDVGLPWHLLLTLLWQHLLGAPNLLAFVVAAVFAIAVAAALGLAGRAHPPALFWTGALLTAVGVLVVLSPRRDFPHYFLFLAVPLTLWFGGAAAALLREPLSSIGRRWRLAVLAVIGAAIPLGARAVQRPPVMIGLLAHDWRNPRSDIARAILRYARPGDTLAIWGWSPTLYVETGLPQAVRDGHVQRQIEVSPQQGYFLARYLRDLERNTPPIFVDVVGPGCFPLEDRARYGHQAYPALNRYIERHYTHVQDIRYARIYLRNDRAAGLRR